MKWWGKNFLFAELLLSVAIAAAFHVWLYEFGGVNVVSETIDGNRAAVYGALASILGSLLGFAITAESIVLGLSGSQSLSLLRKSFHYKTLWRVFISSIRSLSFATAAALFGLVLDRDNHPWYQILTANVFASSLAAVRLFRCIWVLENIVDLIAKAPPEIESPAIPPSQHAAGH